MFWLVLAGLVVVIALLVATVALLHAIFAEVCDLGTVTSDRDHATSFMDEQLRVRDEQLGEVRAQLEQATATATSPLLGQRVVANLTDGSSIRGVLASDYLEAVVLEAAEYLAGQQPEAFAGRAVIPRAHLIWTQALGAD